MWVAMQLLACGWQCNSFVATGLLCIVLPLPRTKREKLIKAIAKKKSRYYPSLSLEDEFLTWSAHLCETEPCWAIRWGGSRMDLCSNRIHVYVWDGRWAPPFWRYRHWLTFVHNLKICFIKIVGPILGTQRDSRDSCVCMYVCMYVCMLATPNFTI